VLRSVSCFPPGFHRLWVVQISALRFFAAIQLNTRKCMVAQPPSRFSISRRFVTNH
jgi:hypothetical protein